MYAKNCARCGKMFAHLSGPPLCPACREEDEKDFKRVKEYLYDHRGASMTEVSEALNISISKLKRFLKEGRIEIMEDSNFVLQCERCGASIRSGQYCDACSKELADELKGVASQVKDKRPDEANGYKKAEKMRYLSRDNIR
jgi:flagellar operon protein (TIGR03826 family)